MRPLTVIGNWKMNGSLANNADWIKTVCSWHGEGMPAGRKYAVCVPAPYLAQCGALIRECFFGVFKYWVLKMYLPMLQVLIPVRLLHPC
jgi:triosephosphate isomerase